MHPIDSLTPNALKARFLWDAARENDINRFLGQWERLTTDHEKEVEYAFDEIPDRESRTWDRVFMEGQQDGFDAGHEKGYQEGYKKAWEEAQAKVRVITGEQLTTDS